MPSFGSRQRQALETRELQAQLRRLATLPADAQSPILSIYLNVENGGWQQTLDERVKALRPAWKGQARADFELALGQAESWLVSQLSPESRGAAVFARVGRWPHLQGLQFAVPLPDLVAADELPVLGPLVELKDDYDRYVVFIAHKHSVRIMEVDLGAVTRELWSRHLFLRERAGEVWGRNHYSEHVDRQDPERFWDEKLKLLDRLIQQGGHNHLIQAGDADSVRRVRSRLPKHLQAKVMELMAVQPHDRIDDVVQQTLASFMAREEHESRDLARQLRAEIRRDGLAVAGIGESLKALRLGAVQTLLLHKGWQAPPGWACRQCGAAALGAAPAACAACNGSPRAADLREEAVRLAQASGAHVEAVAYSEELSDLGGAGCLLRYKPASVEEAGPSAFGASAPASRRHFAHK